MYFKDIIGQDAVKKHLIKTVSDGHVGHALMFAGEEGSGSLPMAVAFAGYMFCESPLGQDRCGKCNACKKMDTISHPDLHFSFPIVLAKNKVEISKHMGREFHNALLANPYISLKDWETLSAGENKKSIIPSQEAEEIIKSLSLKSFSGGHKVLIIWRADKLNNSAANKLLKTLEEPSQKTIVILVVSSPEDLLPTIVSRTQLVKCGRLRDEEIASALVERLGISPDFANKAARIADGDYPLAAGIAGNAEDAHPFLDLFAEWMRTCVKFNLAGTLEICDKLSALNRDKQQYFLEYCLQFLHQSLMYEYTGKENARFDDVALGFAEKFAPYMAKTDLAAFHDIFSKGHYLVQRNVNAHLLFMKMGYDMMGIFKRQTAQHNS